jgi:hypothetical protein
MVAARSAIRNEKLLLQQERQRTGRNAKLKVKKIEGDKRL